MALDPVDSLLERYLELLDEYTQLRAQLGLAQTAVHQHLARANFTAERGIRYGPDFYDDRMQAARRVRITAPPDVPDLTGAPVFQVESLEDPLTTPGSDGARDEETQAEAEAESGETSEPETKPAAETHSRSKDPLRWFGILIPMPLRQAQSQAVQVVENLIPRLASVNAEMLAVEIEVRRARKKRAKASTTQKPAITHGQSSNKHTASAVPVGES